VPVRPCQALGVYAGGFRYPQRVAWGQGTVHELEFVITEESIESKIPYRTSSGLGTVDHHRESNKPSPELQTQLMRLYTLKMNSAQI
jgi:hypothetical protein